MSLRTLHHQMARLRTGVLISGSFAPNGTSALVAASTKGVGFTAARTGVGTFVVTLDDAYNEIVEAQATLQLSTPAAQMAQLGPVTAPAGATRGAVTIVVANSSTGAAADVSANANNRVHFQILCRDGLNKP
jgi:hypothetical protein